MKIIKFERGLKDTTLFIDETDGKMLFTDNENLFDFDDCQFEILNYKKDCQYIECSFYFKKSNYHFNYIYKMTKTEKECLFSNKINGLDILFSDFLWLYYYKIATNSNICE